VIHGLEPLRQTRFGFLRCDNQHLRLINSTRAALTELIRREILHGALRIDLASNDGLDTAPDFTNTAAYGWRNRQQAGAMI
jgi:hypothetical protein